MLAGGHQHAWRYRAAQFGIAPVIVRGQGLFNPLEPVRPGRLRQAGGVGQIQAHPAIEHEPEIGAHASAHVLELGQIFSQAFVALGRAVVQGHLAANKAHLLGQVGARPGGIKLQLVAHRPAKQGMHRLPAHLGQQVPQGQVNPRDGVDDHALAPVEQRGAVHLVPHLLDLGDQAALQKPGQVFLHNEGADLAGRGHPDANRAVARLDLHHQRAQHIEPESLAALAVFWVDRHRARNMVINPVVAALVMVVGAPAAHSQGAHMANGWHGQHGGI